jgi:6-phosphogluconolactonase
MTAVLDVQVAARVRDVAEPLAQAIADELREALARRGRAALALSGGRSPVPMLQALSRQRLDWEQVTVGLVDERWVAEDHPDSNARLLREHLLRDQAAEARFLPMKNAAATASEGCKTARQTLAEWAGQLDVAVLGMGGDGHTASWFPAAPGLDQALDRDHPACCVALQPAGMAVERLSLTLGAIAGARRRYLFFTGSDKWSVLERALAGSDARELPVRALLALPLTVYYAVDASTGEEDA